ncbi:peptide chain release factor N(5)-glutamine methyltransferase [Caldimonas aquatica]|uniref:Release factor glutamine methyltransferase n=1 Tax=Caldimonas aquatica TaxID=376175 RepID=A0ABY6MTY1_9BURK|nr:peptide chain release factor N(5)-glutamine methyltransferase [Schlegelella aquatica]UZD55466.1 peptide chain release factor N(5)-glutamine methyltransferase [Schlegelella aquatica]
MNRTLAAAWQQAVQQSGLERLDAQLLLLHALGRDTGGGGRAWLLAHDADPLPADAARRYDTLVQRRARGEPLAYLVGWREFYGLRLEVNPDVLVPRPDTETLVEWALDCLPRPPAAPQVLDLGTGSGAIALALAHAAPHAHVTGTDCSGKALAVARRNAERLGLAVRWREGRWFEAVARDEVYDLIVSNPPYIAEGDPHLPALAHEPRSALAAGPHGLNDLATIVADARAHLRAGAWLLLEHGHDQAEAVQRLLREHDYADVATRSDLAGRPRCTGGRRP